MAKMYTCILKYFENFENLQNEHATVQQHLMCKHYKSNICIAFDKLDEDAGE